MSILYIFSFLIGLAGIIIALVMMSVQSALDSWWSLASIFSGGMLGLFLLGYICKNVRSAEAAVGVILGVLLIAWMSLSPLYFTEEPLIKLASPFHSYLTIIFGTSIIFLSGFLLSLMVRKKSSSRIGNT